MDSVNENGSSAETEITDESIANSLRDVANVAGNLKHSARSDSQNETESLVADGDVDEGNGSASITPRKKKRRNRNRKGKGEKPQPVQGQVDALQSLLTAKEEEVEPDTAILIQENEVKGSSEFINAQQNNSNVISSSAVEVTSEDGETKTSSKQMDESSCVPPTNSRERVDLIPLVGAILELEAEDSKSVQGKQEIEESSRVVEKVPSSTVHQETLDMDEERPNFEAEVVADDVQIQEETLSLSQHIQKKKSSLDVLLEELGVKEDKDDVTNTSIYYDNLSSSRTEEEPIFNFERNPTRIATVQEPRYTPTDSLDLSHKVEVSDGPATLKETGDIRKKKRRNRNRKAKGKPEQDATETDTSTTETEVEIETLCSQQPPLPVTQERRLEVIPEDLEESASSQHILLKEGQKRGESIHTLLERAKQNAIGGINAPKRQPADMAKSPSSFLDFNDPSSFTSTGSTPSVHNYSVPFRYDANANLNLPNEEDPSSELRESNIAQLRRSSSSGSYEIKNEEIALSTEIETDAVATSTEIEMNAVTVDESESTDEYSVPKFQMSDKMVDQEKLEQQVLETLGDETSTNLDETFSLTIAYPLLEKGLENPIPDERKLFYSKTDENENQAVIDFEDSPVKEKEILPVLVPDQVDDQLVPDEIEQMYIGNNDGEIQDNELCAEEVNITDQITIESPYQLTQAEDECSISHYSNQLLLDTKNEIVERSADASTITDPVVISLIYPNIYTADESLLLDPAALGCNWPGNDFENNLSGEVATMTDPVTVSLPYEFINTEGEPASEETNVRNEFDAAKQIEEKIPEYELSGWKNQFDASDKVEAEEVAETTSAILIDLENDSLDVNVGTGEVEELKIIETPRIVESFSIDCLTQSDADPNGNEGIFHATGSSQKTPEFVEPKLETIATPATGSSSHEALLRLDREWNENETRASYGNVRPTEALISPSRSSSASASSRHSQHLHIISPSVLIEEEKESCEEARKSPEEEEQSCEECMVTNTINGNLPTLPPVAEVEIEILETTTPSSIYTQSKEKDVARESCVKVREASATNLLETPKPFAEVAKRRVGPLKAEHIPIEIPIEQPPAEVIEQELQEEYVASSSDDEKGQVCCGFLRSRSKTSKKGQKKESGRSERSPSLKDRITNAARKHFSKQ